MLRILYLITDLDIGGAEKSLYNLAIRLDRTRFTPIVASLTGHGEVGDWLERAGVRVFNLDISKARAMSVILALRRLLRDLRIDILHTFLFHANIVGRIAARMALDLGKKARRPVVICSVRVAEKRRHHLWLDRLTHSLMDMETCVSESVRQFTIDAGLPAEKMIVIPNGLDVSQIKCVSISAARSQLGIAKDVTLVLSVGRLEEQKGMRFLIKAARKLASQFPEMRFAIAGRGPLEATLKRQVEREGLSNTVTFLGWRSDASLILSASDIFVLPSLWEGMPNVILEAMAHSKPVIATHVGGCPELVVEGETGFLVPPADPLSLAAAIRRVATHPVEATEMGMAGRKRVVEHFGINGMVARNERLYDALIDKSR